MNSVIAISGTAAVYNERLAISLGLATLLLALAIVFSCQSFVSLLNRFVPDNFTRTKGYQSFYKFHAYFWWAFGVVFVMHLLTALMHTGLSTSTAGDPDAYLHLYSIWSGLGGFIVIRAVVFSSCRSPAGFLNSFRDSPLSTNRVYRAFYRYHAYYWLVFLAVVAAHFAFGYIHSGIWPGVPE